MKTNIKIIIICVVILCILTLVGLTTRTPKSVDFLTGPNAPVGNPSGVSPSVPPVGDSNATAVALRGTIVCLPHINTEGPQTMECAYGLKDEKGTYYSLHDTSTDYSNLSSAPMNVPVIVSGSLVIEKSDRYQSSGILNVISVIVVKQTETSNSSEVAVGKTKTINGVSITLHSIIQDNRCPVDVVCIQAGAVTASVTLKMGSSSQTFNISSDKAPHVFAGYKVSITTINPPRMSTAEPDLEAYIVTFHVEKA